jgi:hypothetical protein
VRQDTFLSFDEHIANVIDAISRIDPIAGERAGHLGVSVENARKGWLIPS